MRRGLLTIVAAGCIGCGEGPLAVNGTRGETIEIAAGRELKITLGTVGPGEYASPPAVSSSVLRFLEADQVPPIVPAGIRQRFRFKAQRPGEALVVFHHTEHGPTVEDTIVVH